MDKIEIIGGKELKGTIPISGAKNAALPLLCAALLTKEKITFTNVPCLEDIGSLKSLLKALGVKVIAEDQSKAKLELQAGEITSHVAPYELVNKFRASILVLGPLLARCGQAIVSLPGGCAIGQRPVDMHQDALLALGAEIELINGYLHASAPQGLKGGQINFDKVSVGATENAVMAASLAKGTTVITNAAIEPEVQDLCQLLVKMGAQIDGIGTPTLRIEGQSELFGAEHHIVPDRIEAGTYALCAALAGGDVLLEDCRPQDFEALLDLLSQVGVRFECGDTSLRIMRDKKSEALTARNATTAPHPDFATDLQAQFMTLMTLAQGESVVKETIFENRFMHVPELWRMGAAIRLDHDTAFVKGVDHLVGAQVQAKDLRASASLIMAGLAAQGTTVVTGLEHLDRGYECLVEKLSAVGAQIKRSNEV